MKNEITHLPKWAERFLRAICPVKLYEEIEGDLIERFGKHVAVYGQNRAKLKLLLESLQYIRPGITLRNKFTIELNQIDMVRSYFLLAFRLMLKHKAFSLINISGIAVAMASFLFIILYVAFETGFDRFHTNHDRIYRVALEQYENNALKNSSAKNFPGVYRYLNENIPEVETATRFMKIPANTGFLFGRNEKIYNESGGYINADTNFFKVFPSLLLRGNVNTALKNPNSIVISESIAKKVFGDEDPLGQRLDPIEERSGKALVVTGILRDIPPNAHFHANFVSKLEDVWPEVLEDDWIPSLIFNYALLKEEVEPSSVAIKLDAMLKKASDQVPAIKGSKTILQPITSIHLQSRFDDEFEANGSETLVYLLLGIAILILLMSWINYINIESARFMKRAREVGVRRIIGSAKSDLGFQFIAEFLCITAVAMILAGILVISGLTTFFNITNTAIDFDALYSSDIVKFGIFFIIAGTIITGLYPSLQIIRLKPANALKGSFNGSKRNGLVRKPLVIIQFSISIILIACLLVVKSQLNFMQTTNRKIDIDKVVAIKNPTAYSNSEVIDKYNHFKRISDKLTGNTSVDMVGTSSAIPGTEIGFTYVDLIKRNLNDPYDPTRYKTMFVGENFLQVYGISLLAGRNFQLDQGGDYIDPWERKDWLKIIINEKAAKILGFKSPGEAVNQIVKFKAFDEFEDHEIIGVIEDYHHEAASKDIHPIILKSNFNSYQQVYYSVRLNSGTNPRLAIDELNAAWKEVFPEYPFEYFFLDEYYDQQFKSERKLEGVFSFFGSVAIFIACLGVVGMSLFESNSRIREISIRKVLGASPTSLLALLTRDQARCILLSCAIAFPATWYAAGEWLSSYPLKVELSLMFVIIPAVGVTGMVVSLSLVQALKAVNANPVEHLKNE
jgi:putative ABC transport system permease protein